MAIVNRFSGFTQANSFDQARVVKDSDFGENLNRSVQNLNSLHSTSTSVKNNYLGHVNKFGASSNYSMNEQRMFQSMITESININGISVRFMPRWSEHYDEVWNEAKTSQFHRGFMMDVYLESADGFEGEGDVMSQYGIEFREEVTLRLSIPKFETLQSDFTSSIIVEDVEKYERNRPLEGDLIVIPFGTTSQNKNQYIPKIFEIQRVTTYHDGAFFQAGDNYQYKLRCRLFELSGENLGFSPTVIKEKPDGSTEVVVSETIGPIADAREGLVDSEICFVETDSEVITDPWADNAVLEEIARDQINVDDKGKKLQKSARVMTKDYTAEAFGYSSVLASLDDI